MAENATIEDAPTEEAPVEPESPPEPPAPSVMPSGGTVLALWLPSPARRRLIDADLDIVEDITDRPSLILASTRGPAARRPSLRTMAETAPVVVVCHPGGERVAAEMISHGAVMIVAEGSEVSAIRLLDGTEADHLLDAYISDLEPNWTDGSSSVDAITGLASISGFELRLTELGNDGVVPRLGLVDIGFESFGRTLGAGGEAVLKRRLGVCIESAVRAAGGDMFDLGNTFAILAPGLSVEAAEALGDAIVHIGATFVPNGDPLALAVGWAGPESAADSDSLRLLAERALQVATTRERRVVDAEELSEHAAASVELSANIEIADLVDEFDPRGDHSRRVSAYASELARELQLEPAEVGAIGLAGRLHDIGKAHWGPGAFDPTAAGHEEARAQHSERGAQMIRPTAGPVVGAIVRGHHERWDGAGSPDGLSGAGIPIGARVLAVAHMYDELAVAGIGASAIEQRLREEAGASLDPDLVEAAIAVFVSG